MNVIRATSASSVRRRLIDAGRLTAALAAALGLLTVLLAGCSSGSGGDASGPPPGSGGGAGGSQSGSGGGSGGAGLRPVIYVADQDVFGALELYMSSPAQLGASVQLSPTLPVGGDIDAFAMMPSGESVVYVADQTENHFHELFLVHLANPGAPIKLSAPLGAERDVGDFAISPDGSKVAYRADQDADEVPELYVVDVTNPGVATKVNGPLAGGGQVRDDFKFSPDGTKIAYRADQDVAGTVELYLVDLNAPGVSYRVNSDLVSGGNVYEQFKFSPDGDYLAYIADQDVDQQLELYAVPVATPGVSLKLNGPMVAEGDVCTFVFSPDSTRVAYCADQETDGVQELFTTALAAAGVSVKLNPPLAAGGQVTHRYVFGQDSSFVLYIAHQDSAEEAELYRVDVASPGAATRLSAPLVAGGDVRRFALSPDGARVAYLANQDDAAVVELYEVNLASPGNATRMSAPMTDFGVYAFAYEDDENIVYLATQDSAVAELYRVSVVASGASSRLNGNLVQDGEVWEFAIVP